MTRILVERAVEIASQEKLVSSWQVSNILIQTVPQFSMLFTSVGCAIIHELVAAQEVKGSGWEVNPKVQEPTRIQ